MADSFIYMDKTAWNTRSRTFDRQSGSAHAKNQTHEPNPAHPCQPAVAVMCTDTRKALNHVKLHVAFSFWVSQGWTWKESSNYVQEQNEYMPIVTIQSKTAFVRVA